MPRADLLAAYAGLLAALLHPMRASAQGNETGTVAGIVMTDERMPLAGATVRLSQSGGDVGREATSDAEGRFSIAALPPGLYRVSARRISYRAADLPLLRVVGGQTAQLVVTLTRSPTQLSTVRIERSATAIDASTTELTQRIDLQQVASLPTGRDVASLVELVPGARRGSVWGGAGDAANSYQLDGVALNHPGTGGDFLAPSIDWIETLEIRGLGAGAEHGSFQGGIVNAVTKTGDNERRGAMRTSYDTPALSASNIRVNEEGAEEAARLEASGETSGPVVRDRVFYFVGAQYVGRTVRLPDITASAPRFRPDEQGHRDLRGIAKLTWRPGAGDRMDVLVGHSRRDIERAGLNGLDEAVTAHRVVAPATFYELAWHHEGSSSSFDARLAGFDARQDRTSQEGSAVPGIQLYSRGRQPLFQNAPFEERAEPRSIGGGATWRQRWPVLRGEDQLAYGAEWTRGRWRDERTRNGGMTWRPYPSDDFDAREPATWPDAASEWGGEIRLDADVWENAVFVQNDVTPLPGLTLSAGLRWASWTGWLTPANGARFAAAHDDALDPRLGVIWDVSGRNTLVLKSHWGRYHQGMFSLFFDRAQGADVYGNQRLYIQGPAITDPRQTYTTAQRDAMQGGDQFGTRFIETILNEAGRVENYRQPYVEQLVLSLEKSFGASWKGEISYVNRRNRDIVGLVDRNMASNYSKLTNVRVRQRISSQPVIVDGEPFVLAEVWVANNDLADELRRRDAELIGGSIPGYTIADAARLRFSQDIVLTTIPEARRQYHQLSMSVRASRPRWSALGAVTAARLEGNTPGLTGFGAAGTRFSAGPFVRPNEAINADGKLPGGSELEGKMWVTAHLPAGFTVGAFTTALLGERITRVFELSPAFRFDASNGTELGSDTFRRVRGQTIYIDPRGTHRYEARATLDLRIERRTALRGAQWTLSLDLLNALGASDVISQNLIIDDEVSRDPTAEYAAPRQRVQPRTFRLGTRLEFRAGDPR